MYCCKLLLLTIFTIVISASVIQAKVFGRCELAKDLLNKYHLPKNQIATWVCIANYESNFNTAAVNRKTGDHGIFQINQKFWCSTTSKPGKGCHATCAQFEDNNIKDDVDCIKKIYDETKRLKGNGFSAWVAYRNHCTGDNSKWTKGCF